MGEDGGGDGHVGAGRQQDKLKAGAGEGKRMERGETQLSSRQVGGRLEGQLSNETPAYAVPSRC